MEKGGNIIVMGDPALTAIDPSVGWNTASGVQDGLTGGAFQNPARIDWIMEEVCVSP